MSQKLDMRQLEWQLDIVINDQACVLVIYITTPTVASTYHVSKPAPLSE